MQGVGTRWASDAGSEESDTHDSVIGDAEQFDVTAVFLDSRSHQLKDIAHALG
jgi:hypothetical protein